MVKSLPAWAISLTLALSHAMPLKLSQSLAIVEIQQTLNTFSIAVDTHDFTILANVFTANATANFNDTNGELTGLTSISTALRKGLQGLKTWHALSTQVVDFDSLQKANATSYLQGTFFGEGNLTGQADTTYGQYFDTLELTELGWRITRKTLLRAANIGNTKILD